MKIVSISDGQFRIGVVGGGVALAAVFFVLRFCGSVTLPKKPPAPSGSSEATVAATAAYKEHLAKDAAAAGVAAPTIEAMSSKLPYHFDDKRHVLELDPKPIEIAGLRIALARSGAALVLQIENRLPTDVAYHVVSTPLPSATGCNSAQALPFNAMVLARGERINRVECGWRTGMSIAVTRVETVELPALSAYYINQLPPSLVGIEPRIARGHLHPKVPVCSAMASYALESGLQGGEITWRDLIDFHARYRCQTYQFPLEYRALE